MHGADNYTFINSVAEAAVRAAQTLLEALGMRPDGGRGRGRQVPPQAGEGAAPALPSLPAQPQSRSIKP